MNKLKLSILLCLSAAAFFIARRPQRNHPSGSYSTEQEDECLWVNHGGFARETIGGH
jgi:hypothetical protein